jgi:NAD(P)-dependent dehydrogenase (short-subunit alcohol dehydrogenase family)
VEQAGRRAVPVPGDQAEAAHCRSVIDSAVAEFGRIDVLVSNAAQQRTHDKPEDGPGQPAEVAPVYAMLASHEASYVSGARVAVTGGKTDPVGASVLSSRKDVTWQ